MQDFLFEVEGNDSIVAYVKKRNDDSEKDQDKSDDGSDDYSGDKEEIGKLTVDQDEDGNIWLDHVEVDVPYRRHKIAERMLIKAIKELELTRIACVQESAAYRFCLTPDGEGFIAGCVRKRILTSDMCCFSSDSATGSPYILSGEAEDPGYASVIVSEALNHNNQNVPQENEKNSQKLITAFFKPDPEKANRKAEKRPREPEVAQPQATTSAESEPNPKRLRYTPKQ